VFRRPPREIQLSWASAIEAIRREGASKQGARTSNERVRLRNMGDSLSLSRRGNQIKRSTSSSRSHLCELTAAAPAAECHASATQCVLSNYETLTTQRKQ
jgi:hypothetical protein